jgi:hypothetical protein
MKESYDEGVANHIDPESCGGGSNAMAEALTGVRAGRVLGRKMGRSRRNCTAIRFYTFIISTFYHFRHIFATHGIFN